MAGAKWTVVRDECWEALLAEPGPKLILCGPAVRPVWIEREGDEVAFVTARGSPLATLLATNPDGQLAFGDHLVRVRGRLDETAAVGEWEERIWRRYRPDQPLPAHGPAGLLVRLVLDPDCLHSVPEIVHNQRMGFASDSARELRAKVLFQVNEWVPHLGVEGIANGEVHFARDVDRLPGRRLQIPRQELLSETESAKLLSNAFQGGPAWVNVNIHAVKGKVWLLTLTAGAPQGTPTHINMNLQRFEEVELQ